MGASLSEQRPHRLPAAGCRQGRVGLLASMSFTSQNLILHKSGALELPSQGGMGVGRGGTFFLEHCRGPIRQQRKLSLAHVPMARCHGPRVGMLLAVAWFAQA